MKKMKYKQKLNTEDLHALLHRTVQFYTPRPTPLAKEYQPRLIRSPTDHDLDVKKTLKEI